MAKTHLPCVGVGILGVVEKWWITHILPLIVPWHYGWVKVTGGLGGGEGCLEKCKVSGLFIKRKE